MVMRIPDDYIRFRISSANKDNKTGFNWVKYNSWVIKTYDDYLWARAVRQAYVENIGPLIIKGGHDYLRGPTDVRMVRT